jgi:hypothetical protein
LWISGDEPGPSLGNAALYSADDPSDRLIFDHGLLKTVSQVQKMTQREDGQSAFSPTRW